VPPKTLAETRRDMACLRFVIDQIKEIEAARLKPLEQIPKEGRQAMARLLARVIGVGIETADMLIRNLRSHHSAMNRFAKDYIMG
jgi:transposase